MIRPDAAPYASAALPRGEVSSQKNTAASDQANPGSTGLRVRKKRTARNAPPTRNPPMIHHGSEDVPVADERMLFSGRQNTATTTDSRNNSPKRGAIPAMVRPRSRM